MNFNQLNYLPGILLAFAVFVVVLIMLERRFFKLVKTYWFYRRSTFSYISSALLILGMGGLLLSLLDVRGPEEKIKTPIPSDRTIILVDTSASMLAEDVKPSRLQKAVLIAKHFARKAPGHQLSVVAFAEIQKKIVPFTTDLDLIDSRLDSLKMLRNQYGSSALSAAIQESVQYFKETGGEARGNILVLTDGEETSNGMDLKIAKDIHVALVGIGTTQGGRIPLDDGRGFRFGYKKDKGQDVITKLNENFFKQVTKEIPSSKYWLANSYTLPSDEILDFFKSEKVKGIDEQDMIIKPVMMEWIVIPALLLLILSYFFKALKIFSLGMLLVILPLHAQEAEKEVEYTPELLHRMEQLQKGELNRAQKVKLADELYKAGAKGESLALYEENLPLDKIDHSVPQEAYLNYGTALLEKGEGQKGLAVYDQLASSLDPKDSKTLAAKEMIEKNTISFFKQEEQKKQDKKNQKNQDNQDNNKDDKNQNQGQSGQQKDQKQKSGKDDKKEDEKDKQDNKDEKKEDKNEGEDKEDKKDESDSEDNKDQDKKPLPPKKIPAKLKQLMSDDRQLQMKMIENGTKDMNKRKSRQNKDW